MTRSRLLVAVLAPLLFFSALEGALRLAGAGHATSFHLERSVGGAPCRVDNVKFGWRFFNSPRLARKPWPFVLPAHKATNEVRVFVLGESAAMGDPDPAFGFCRILETMLEAQPGGRRFRVINTGMVAINSHVVREIARDVARLEPDVVLVYMGNNEVIGPYGPGSVFSFFSSRLGLIRASLWLKSLRTSQVLAALLRSRADKQASWQGMEQFLGTRLQANDPRLQSVYEFYGRNLGDIVAVSKKSGARVIVSTVAVNLRDCPPFGGDEAVASYRKGAFAKARDLDVYRFRADSTLNRLARDTAQREGVELFDTETLLAGDGLFLDHVHFTFRGNYELASGFFRMLAPGEPPPIDACAAALAYTPYEAYTTSRDMFARHHVPPFTAQPGHELKMAAWQAQLDAGADAVSAATLVRLRPAYEQAIARHPDDWVLHHMFGNYWIALGHAGHAVEEHRTALELIPQAIEPYHREAFALAEQGHPDDALALMLSSDPERTRKPAEIYAALAESLVAQDQSAAAAPLLEKVVRLEPGDLDARYNLAVAFARLGRFDEARTHTQEVLRRDPGAADAASLLKELAAEPGAR